MNCLASLSPLGKHPRSRKLFATGSATIAALASLGTADAADRYVAQNGQTPVPPYSSWSTAATHIQDAVSASAAGDTIWVGPGTYRAPATPPIHDGPNVVLVDKLLTIKSSSGDPVDTIIDGQGSHRGIAVKYLANSTNRFVLEGITVRSGSTSTRGGGVFIDTGNKNWGSEIRNCIVRDNVSDSDGGGVATTASPSNPATLLVEDSLIVNNRASEASGLGGGLFFYMGTGGLTLRNSEVRGNTAYRAGGVRMSFGTNLIENSRIIQNHAAYNGGGVETTGANTVRNTLIADNLCDEPNSVNRGGGGFAIVSNDKTNVLENCTVAGNKPSGIWTRIGGGTVAISNSIIYANNGADVGEHVVTTNPGTVTYTDVCSTTLKPGTGNTTSNPQFSGSDYYLKSTSPCIDTGSVAGWMSTATDLDGNARLNGTVDRGCYEYRPAPMLVENGVANAEIVVSPTPFRMATWAAQELQDYFFKITGATVPIVTTKSPGVALQIYVGKSTETGKLKLSAEGLDDGAFQIRTGNSWIAFLGQDDDFIPPDPIYEAYSSSYAPAQLALWDAYTGHTWGNPVSGLARKYNRVYDIWEHDKKGSLNAVHQYLRSLGVRWYYPGDLGEIVPQISTLNLPRTNEETHPDFAARNMYFQYNTYSAATLDEIKWQMRLGLNSGLEHIGLGPIGHGIQYLISRPEVKQNHPEYYAQWSGNAEYIPGPCLTSSGLLAENIAFAQASFDYFHTDVISVTPTDGYGRLCEHPGCAGLDTPLRGKNGLLSDYVWSYVNTVAQSVALTHPNQRINACAYSTYLLPPEQISMLSPNISVTLCRWRTWFYDQATKEAYSDVTIDWLSKLSTGDLYIWDYYLHSRDPGNYAGVPVYFPQLISEDLKFLKGKSRGEFIEVHRNYGPDGDTWDSLASNHLNIYITARLWWDANQDVNALLDEYYVNYYGPAAAQMKAFIEYCEVNWPTMRTPEGTALVDHAMTLLTAASNAAGGGKYSQRIGLVSQYAERLTAYRMQYGDRYVAQNGQTPVWPYNSWATAATNIQDAVSATQEGYTVWIAPGVYTASATPLTHEGSNVVLAERVMTIRSSSGDPTDTIIDGEEVNRGIAVKYYKKTTAKVIIDGLTMKNGLGTTGGGVYLDSGNYSWDAEVRNCIIQDNIATGNGGGIATRNNTSQTTSALLIENCLIEGNEASNTSGLGGGIYTYLEGGGLTLLNSEIRGNSAYRGGGIRVARGNNWIENTRITDNDAIRAGGGLDLYASAVLRNTLIDTNRCVEGGGTNRGGGGIATIVPGATTAIENCTIAANTPSGVMSRLDGGTMTITNSIIYGNTSNILDYPVTANPATMTYTYNCTASTLPGTGNIVADPLFAGPDFHLSNTSPCLNSGQYAPWMDTSLDLDGNDRLNGTVDRGCYEAP